MQPYITVTKISFHSIQEISCRFGLLKFLGGEMEKREEVWKVVIESADGDFAF